jgi:L-amino acid N-acyltransferase YncA
VCGFQHCGVMKNVGVKFDRWLDVVVMQLEL